MSNVLKRLGFIWKPTRRSLKKNEMNLQSRLEIEEMRAQAERGEITLAYVDESGFSLAQPNRSAWSLLGTCHKIDANRGKRLNVIGAMLSTGDFFSVAMWQTNNSLLFTGLLGLLMNYVGKPLTVILDNASFHKVKVVQPMLKVLAQKGLKLYFLSPHSPELNRIEKFWHKVKYELMEFKT